MFDLNAIQAALLEAGLDGWLFYDFRGLNPLALRVLKFPQGRHSTRRFFYFVPSKGEPVKIVHSIEAGALDHLPGEKRVYVGWRQLEHQLGETLSLARQVAMEYSPRNENPYVSRVDGGTLELIASFGVTVISSGDLIQQFEAVLTPRQWDLHLAAAELTQEAFRKAWSHIGQQVAAHGEVTEREVLSVIQDHFDAHEAIIDHPAIVAVNANAGLPHYETGHGEVTRIRQGDLVLIDLWAKLPEPDAIYSDLTKMCFVGGRDELPESYRKVFDIVAQARDAGIQHVQQACLRRESVSGASVDQVVRKVIEEAGYGQFFTHRTGHSLGQELHGNGAHLDDIETCDTRKLIPGCLFTIEPGVYLPEFGVRLETNLFIDREYQLHITGGDPQADFEFIGPSA